MLGFRWIGIEWKLWGKFGNTLYDTLYLWVHIIRFKTQISHNTKSEPRQVLCTWNDSHTSIIKFRYIMQDLEHEEGFGRVVQERYGKSFCPIYSEHKTKC